MIRAFLLIALASCSEQCDDRYHKAEDYKHEPESTHSSFVAPVVVMPPPVLMPIR